MLEDVAEIVGVNWERVALSREYGNTVDRECQSLGSIFPRNVKSARQNAATARGGHHR